MWTTEGGESVAARHRAIGFMAGVLAVAALLVPAAAPLAAEAGTVEAQLIVKAIRFLSSKPSGSVPVAVVYDPGDPASRVEAERLAELLRSSQDGVVSPVAQPVAADALAVGSPGEPATIVAVVIPGGLPAAVQKAVAKALAGRAVLTASTNPACARSGSCVLAARNEPKPQFLLNTAAAETAGVQFSTGFLMLVDEM